MDRICAPTAPPTPPSRKKKTPKQPVEQMPGRPWRRGGRAYWEMVIAIVDQAPPLTLEQRAELRVLLQPTRRPADDTPASHHPGDSDPNPDEALRRARDNKPRTLAGAR